MATRSLCTVRIAGLASSLRCRLCWARKLPLYLARRTFFVMPCGTQLERHNERRRNLNSLKLSAKQAGTAVMPGLPGHSSLAPATAAGMTQRQLKRAASPEVEPEVAPDVEPEVEPPTAANAGSEGGVEEPCFSALSAAVMQGSTGGLKLEAMDLVSSVESTKTHVGWLAGCCTAPPCLPCMSSAASRMRQQPPVLAAAPSPKGGAEFMTAVAVALQRRQSRLWFEA